MVCYGKNLQLIDKRPRGVTCLRGLEEKEEVKTVVRVEEGNGGRGEMWDSFKKEKKCRVVSKTTGGGCLCQNERGYDK